MQPCINPHCKSFGHEHPNCMCHTHNADGGEVSERFCDGSRLHSEGCEYFAEGGIAFTPDPQEPSQEQPINFQPDDQQAALQDKYGGLGQQAVTAGEGLAKGALGPVATLAEKKLGVPVEDIKGRAEANPLTHGASEVAGFVIPAVLSEGASSFSQAGALRATGEALTEGLGLQGVKATAVKLGAENALLALGDELSKSIVNDPSSIQTAAAHVGLAGLLGVGAGAGVGKLSELWLNKLGPKAEEYVKAFTDTLKSKAADTVEEVPFVPSADEPIKNLPRPGSPLFKETPAPEAAPPGVKDASKFVEHISNLASEAAADSLGGGIGHIAGKLTGIPGLGILGGYIGHNSVAPLLRTYLPSVVKGLLEKESSATGLKAAFDAVSDVVKGDSAISNAAKGLFESGSNKVLELPETSHEELDKLDHHVSQLGNVPQQMLQDVGQLGHYMPEHQTALASTSQNAVNYLNSVRPQGTKPGPLNTVVEPTALKHSAYERTLEIASQPLAIMQYLKKGTLRPKDVQDLRNLYPSVHNTLLKKVSDQLIDHMSKGRSVPFQMRRGLSMLMGQPLDAIMAPSAAMAIQATYTPIAPQAAQVASAGKKGTSKLDKTSKLAQTPTEARIEALQKA